MLGGERNTQVMVQTGRDAFGHWKTKRLRLTWPNGTNFDFTIQDACVAKVAIDSFFVLGGRNTSTKKPLAKVFNINMTDQTIEEVGSLTYPRSEHACALIPDPSSSSASRRKLILVAGGLPLSNAARDEIFDPEKGRFRTIDNPMNVPRFQHQIVNIGQKVFAFGGQRHPDDNSRLDVIEVFDVRSETWSLHSSSLLSKSTDGLAATELPRSAISCSQGCQCGVRSGARIVGGVDVQVDLFLDRLFLFLLFM